ncbi:hypothetical protein H0H87_008854 [Tephrocybe sp. NHM501043]|nr:hypothetical protein H0H87_008854 [Tephrocybe sp. NHM501043]
MGQEEDSVFRCIWVPVQTLTITTGRTYGATVYYRVDDPGNADVDLGLNVKPISTDGTSFDIQPATAPEAELPGGWSQISIQITVPGAQKGVNVQTGAIGLVVAILTADQTKDLDVKIRIGQLNVYAIPPATTAIHSPMMLWADFTTPASKDISGKLSWEVAASFPPLTTITVTSPDDPRSAWTVQPSNNWFPQFMYFNVYALLYSQNNQVGQPEDATWIGTTGWIGHSNKVDILPTELPFWSEVSAERAKVRFYIQGVTDHGVVLDWDKCVFVDSDFSGLLV